MENNRLTYKNYIVIGSLIFGMLFGAGNLIFPVHLGQLAGANWWQAALGFLTSGVLLPVLGLLAISITSSQGIYDLARPIGHHYSLSFMILIYATIGPFFATPRTATVPFTIGFDPYLPKTWHTGGLLLYSALFFLLVYYLSSKESKITVLIAKVLNPVFLLMLFVIFLLAFSSPLALAKNAPITLEYATNALSSGLLQGYNTMDALASLAFGITVITAVKQLGVTEQKEISLATAKGGSLGILSIGVIYIALILLGAQSVSTFGLAENGGITLTQIAHHYLGVFGDALLATLTTVTCLSTSMGLVIASSQTFHQRFEKISYKQMLALNCLLSFTIANLGLDTIISWSLPVLMFLYPLAITLILLGITSPLFQKNSLVYQTTTLFTLIPALFDLVNALPAGLKQTSFVQSMLRFASRNFPFFELGFGWICFSLLGFFIGIIWYLAHSQKRAQ